MSARDCKCKALVLFINTNNTYGYLYFNNEKLGECKGQQTLVPYLNTLLLDKTVFTKLFTLK